MHAGFLLVGKERFEHVVLCFKPTFAGRNISRLPSSCFSSRGYRKLNHMMRKTFFSTLLLWLVCAGVQAALEKPSREVFGLRLGISEEAVHKRMRKIATQQKEEREEEEGGEQEVWVLKKDSRYNYLLTKFSREHRLILVTVVAHPNRVRYSDLGETKDATVATDGMNYSYKWKIPARKDKRAVLLIARGGNAEVLTSYSLYLTR
jgi:hypothetical protein